MVSHRHPSTHLILACHTGRPTSGIVPYGETVTNDASSGHLLAVLLNPPSASSGALSIGAVRRATAVLGYDGFEITNLFGEPTPTVIELNLLTIDGYSWCDRQRVLLQKLHAATSVLAAWGVAGASGELRRQRDQRAAWLMSEAARCGHSCVWMVGGEPRHPSRWHQYVADKHGRTTGGTLEERLAEVLVRVPVTDVGKV